MIKNKDILEMLERKRNEVSCENCEHCHLGAYHSGKWYCKHPNISCMNPPSDITNCFERRNQRGKR